MHALHLASECEPLVQAGGIAAVVQALPAALRAAGVEASVALPLYGGRAGPIARAAEPLGRVWDGPDGIAVWRAQDFDTPTYLVETPAFAEPDVYQDAQGDALPDERFVAFQLAVLAWLRADPDARPDVLHLHDHHAALVPALLRGDAAYEVLADLPTVLTVHGADHQGVLRADRLADLGLDPALLTALRSSRDPDDAVSSLRVGVATADAVLVPSPTYARELRGDGVAPRGLGATFREAADRTTGIVHGLDRAVWSPRFDPHLPAPFSADNPEGKHLAKASVCRALGLDPGGPLLTYVGRLMPENGVEILFESVERLLGVTDARIAILGLGPPEHEAQLRGLAGLVRTQEAPGRLAMRLAFDRPLAHRLLGGADILLAPARTQPSARSAMIACAYGTVPVGHAVGAFRDVVCPAGEPARGICFEGFATTPFVEAVRGAIERMADAEAWQRLQTAGMRAEFSWLRTAEATAEVYRAVAGGERPDASGRGRFVVRS